MNTKRVIQYFATIAVTGEKKKDQQPGKMQVCHWLPLLVFAQDCACKAETINAYFWVAGLSKGRKCSTTEETVRMHSPSTPTLVYPCYLASIPLNTSGTLLKETFS